MRMFAHKGLIVTRNDTDKRETVSLPSPQKKKTLFFDCYPAQWISIKFNFYPLLVALPA